MVNKRMRLVRWIAGLSAGGVLLQANSCSAGSVLGDQIVIPQITALFSDTIFFLLDNALVRLTT